MGNQIGPCLFMRTRHKTTKPEAKAIFANYQLGTKPVPDAVVDSKHGTGPQPVPEPEPLDSGAGRRSSSSPMSFVCEICVESKALQDSFNPKGCVHFFCTECVVNYVVSKLSDNLVLNVPCPVPGCSGALDPEFCRGILPEEWFDRWGLALCDLAIKGSVKFYCPYKNCSALLINENSRCRGDPEPVYSECPHCKRGFCVRCNEVWHQEMDCVGYQKLKKKGEDTMLEDLAERKKWRRCPNCKVYVDKIAGCAFMTCRCGAYFCYDCGTIKQITDNHYCNYKDALTF